MTNKHMSYGAESISWEQGADKYRRNPARFLGSQDILGIRNQFVEILDNSIDETIRYSAENKIKEALPVNITINEDESVIIEDFGQGIPCEIHPKYGVPAIYPICESDSAGGKSRGTSGYSGIQTAGVHGAGLAVSIACTEYTELQVDSVSADGRFLLRYEKGIRDPKGLERIGNLEEKSREEQVIIGVSKSEMPEAYMRGGTKITYKYDESVFKKTLNGRSMTEAFSKEEIENKIYNALMGSNGEFKVNFKYKNEPMVTFTYEDAKPESVFNDQSRIAIIEAGYNGVQPFRIKLYLQVSKDNMRKKTKTLVNRLEMYKSTSTPRMVDCVTSVVLDRLALIKKELPQYKDVRITSRVVEQYLNYVEIINLTGGTFDGQTKQKLTSTDYLMDFERELTSAMKSSESFFNNIVIPILQAEIEKHEDQIRIEKARQKEKERQERMKKTQKTAQEVNQLLENKSLRAQNKIKSKITIKDSPFRTQESTLVYVEGESAGSVFNNIHDEGEIPVAIALAKGNMPNVTYEEMIGNQLTKDNIVYCLKAGYKDIAIFTDADSDGLHIKILHLMQILTFAKHYLDTGRVYLIPSPYSKVNVRKPMVLDLYGEQKIYTVGENYCYSAKEHQSLTAAGATVIRKFTGLADSDLSPNYLLKHKENWIKLKNITDQDIQALNIVLSGETLNFRRSYTADIFSDRQFREKYIFSNRNGLSIETKEYNRLLNPTELQKSVDFSGYEGYITDDIIQKMQVLKKK